MRPWSTGLSQCHEERRRNVRPVTFIRMTSTPSSSLSRAFPFILFPYKANSGSSAITMSTLSTMNPAVFSDPVWTHLERRVCLHSGILHNGIPQPHPVGMGFQEILLGATLDIRFPSFQEGIPRLCLPAFKSTLLGTVQL